MTAKDASPPPVTGGGVAGGPVRAAASVYFGERLTLAERYASMLTTDGVIRGLIGPHEAPRIWQRHLLNCAAVTELIPAGAQVLDAGSGAGLPGLVLAVARPDLGVTLVEPKLRATTFLSEVVAALAIEDRVTVVRARAEECHGRLAAVDVVTARALAPLDRLAGWCLPLLRTGGRLLALKGESAEGEVAAHAAAVQRLGGRPVIRHCGAERLAQPTLVVEIIRERRVRPRS